MKQSFVIHAEPRSLQGKGASRRLRREGKVPAILYGGTDEAVSISTNHNELVKHTRHRGFFSQLLDVELNGKRETVVLKDLQRHPARGDILHLDLLRVQANQMLRSNIPLDFSGGETCPGVKNQGGVIEHHLIEIEVECLPEDLPGAIPVDLSALDVGDVVRVSDLKLPEGVRSVALMQERDPSVVALHLPRAAIEAETDEEAAASDEAGAAEPEADAGDDAKPEQK